MGEAELNKATKTILIHSHIITYGSAASELLTEQIREEIEGMWNKPGGQVTLQKELFRVQFCITAEWRRELLEMEVLQNTDPRNNYFRIENVARTSISFVDGLGCNSGYFLLDNLYKGSTTAAHEYGHTLGLDHPRQLDLRGQGRPGIMYPRGTLVDAVYQYDPSKPAGVTGGTMHPMHREVTAADISNIRLDRLSFTGNRAVVGAFTNVYHWSHAEDGPADFLPPAVVG